VKPGAAILPALLAALCILIPPASAQNRSMEELCRLHGIGQEEHLTRIGEAYAAARKAGIGEQELLPFLEEILKHKLDCAQMVRVLSAATTLREEGLPYHAVFSKVREGVAKEAASAQVVEAAEAKLKALSASRDVLESLASEGYEIRDFQNAAVIVASYIEKGYTPGEIVTQIRRKGIQGAGFAALSGVVERKVKRKER
jgi:hypothetical protein